MRRLKALAPLFAGLMVTVGSLTMPGCFGRPAFVAVGTAIDVLPGGYATITVGTSSYYYHRGIFYRPYRWGYIVVPAPIGAWVPWYPRPDM